MFGLFIQLNYSAGCAKQKGKKMYKVSKARQTKTLVVICDGENDAPFMLVCDKHNLTLDCENITQAKLFASSPIDWCEDCATEYFANKAGA